jgi:rod shape-determining protein MreD
VKVLRLPLLLLLAGVIQLAAVTFFPRIGLWVDLPLVVVLRFALVAEPAGALLAGLASGLFKDAIWGGLYGLFGFADTLVAYWVSRASRNFVLEGIGVILLTGAAAAAAQQGVMLILVLLFQENPELPSTEIILARILSTGVLTLAFGSFQRRWQRFWERRRHMRAGRIRLK